MFTHTSDFQLQRAATESWTHFGRQMPVYEVVNGPECWLMLWLVVRDVFTANVRKRVASEQHQITDNASKFKVKSAKADMLRSPSTFQNRSNILSTICHHEKWAFLMGGTARSSFFLEPAALHLNPDQRQTKGRAEQRLFKAGCISLLSCLQ